MTEEQNKKFIKMMKSSEQLTSFLLDETQHDDLKFELAQKLAQFNVEISLKVMIKLIVSSPHFFDQSIKSFIYSYIQTESNANIYHHIVELLNEKQNIHAKKFLEEIKADIKMKYHLMGVHLT